MTDRRAEIEARFGASAEAYAASPGHRAGADLERMVELARPRSKDEMLDVATGAGHTALRFAPLVSHVTVTDLSQKMIDVASRLFEEAGYFNAQFVTVGVEHLHVLGDEAFDLVTCRIAPHHFVDLTVAVSEIAGVLKRGGRFVCVDNLGPDDPRVATLLHEVELARDPTHVRSYTRDEWTRACEAAELRVRAAETVPKRLEFEPWLERAGCDAATCDLLRSRFLDAEPDTRDYLGIEIVSGGVVAWTDHKLVLLAERP